MLLEKMDHLLLQYLQFQMMVNMNVDLGLIEMTQGVNITGRVWIDSNSNGIRDSGESGRNGIEVILYNDDGVEVARTTTAIIGGMSGSYIFANLEIGDYYIEFLIEEGLIPTITNVGTDESIDSDVTEENGPFTTASLFLSESGISDLDLGLVEESNTGDINGLVWIDNNGNGVRENGEAGRNGIEVVLYDENDVEIGRATTRIISGMSGSYRFLDVSLGNYYIQFEVQDELVPTIANAGMDDTVDSDYRK